MKRDRLLDLLRQHADALRAEGIETLYLFGSFARDQAGKQSDVDLLLGLKPDTVSLTGLIAIKRRLETALDRAVDMTVLPLSNPYLRAELERDRVQVY